MEIFWSLHSTSDLSRTQIFQSSRVLLSCTDLSPSTHGNRLPLSLNWSYRNCYPVRCHKHDYARRIFFSSHECLATEGHFFIIVMFSKASEYLEKYTAPRSPTYDPVDTQFENESPSHRRCSSGVSFLWVLSTCAFAFAFAISTWRQYSQTMWSYENGFRTDFGASQAITISSSLPRAETM